MDVFFELLEEREDDDHHSSVHVEIIRVPTIVDKPDNKHDEEDADQPIVGRVEIMDSKEEGMKVPIDITHSINCRTV